MRIPEADLANAGVRRKQLPLAARMKHAQKVRNDQTPTYTSARPLHETGVHFRVKAKDPLSHCI
jgi:hypothetical protein